MVTNVIVSLFTDMSIESIDSMLAMLVLNFLYNRLADIVEKLFNLMMTSTVDSLKKFFKSFK